MNVYGRRWQQALPEVLRGVNGSLDGVGMEIDELGVGGVVAGQQTLVGEPETVVAAEHGLERLPVGGQNAGRNAELRKVLHREGLELVVGCNRSSHTMPSEYDHLLEFGIIDGLSGEKGSAERS